MYISEESILMDSLRGKEQRNTQQEFVQDTIRASQFNEEIGGASQATRRMFEQPIENIGTMANYLIGDEESILDNAKDDLGQYGAEARPGADIGVRQASLGESLIPGAVTYGVGAGVSALGRAGVSTMAKSAARKAINSATMKKFPSLLSKLKANVSTGSKLVDDLSTAGKSSRLANFAKDTVDYTAGNALSTAAFVPGKETDAKTGKTTVTGTEGFAEMMFLNMLPDMAIAGVGKLYSGIKKGNKISNAKELISDAKEEGYSLTYRIGEDRNVISKLNENVPADKLTEDGYIDLSKIKDPANIERIKNEDTNVAYKDGDRYVIKTEKHGEVVGEFKDGKFYVDEELSNITKDAYIQASKSDGKVIPAFTMYKMEGSKDISMSGASPHTVVFGNTSQAFTEIKNKPYAKSMAGYIVKNSPEAEWIQKYLGQYDTNKGGNGDIVSANTDRVEGSVPVSIKLIKALSEDPEGITKIQDPNNPFNDEFRDVVKNLVEIHKEITTGVEYSSGLKDLKQEFEKSVKKAIPSNEMDIAVQALLHIEDGVAKLSPQVEETLNVALAKYLLKQGNAAKNHKLDLDKLTDTNIRKAIASDAVSMMNLKGKKDISDAKLNSIVQDKLQSLLSNVDKNLIVDHIYKSIDPEGKIELKDGKIVGKHKLNDRYENMNIDEQSISNTATRLFADPYKSPNRNKVGIVTEFPVNVSKDMKNFAENMAKQKFKFHESTDTVLEELSKAYEEGMSVYYSDVKDGRKQDITRNANLRTLARFIGKEKEFDNPMLVDDVIQTLKQLNDHIHRIKQHQSLQTSLHIM